MSRQLVFVAVVQTGDLPMLIQVFRTCGAAVSWAHRTFRCRIGRAAFPVFGDRHGNAVKGRWLLTYRDDSAFVVAGPIATGQSADLPCRNECSAPAED